MDELSRKSNIAEEVAHKVFINYGSDGYLLNLIVRKLEEKLYWPDREVNEIHNRLHKGEVNTNNENELK